MNTSFALLCASAPLRLCVKTTTAAFVFSLFLALISSLTHAAAPKWNILFCFADDWGRYASCYAAIDGKPSLNDVVRTPNVDRLAREGVLFRNAFVNDPSCTPCRRSLLSGRYFFTFCRGAMMHGRIL